jgi:hypothetical protein
MKKIYNVLRERLSGLAVILMLGGGQALQAQSTVLIPSSGSNTVACGTNVLLQDHAGSGIYSNNVNGFTVLDAGFGAVINISGTYTTEANYDYIYIYNGAGTTGTVMGIYHGSGNINITGIAGQTITVRFYSDGSVVYQGFDLNVTYTGPCFATPCSGTPGPNAAVTPTFAICPNSTVGIGIANSYTVGGIAYQWQSSTTSSVGPYTNVSTGTNQSMGTPPLTQPTWYQAIITCTNSNQSITSAPGLVMVQPTTTNTVPYFEGFEGIVKTNDLPNCSWLATPGLGGTAFTYTAANTQGRWARTGSKFASYYYTPSGTRTIYTNGVWLNAGVTYSAEVWFMTEYYGYTNWQDLSIVAGPNQNATGQFTIASTSGPAVSSSYRQLSNTFQVTQSGLYYFGIKGQTSGSCCGYYLSWDDFAVTVPCQLNMPAMTINPNTSTVCVGQPVTISASGANTYSWNIGSNASSINDTPLSNITYVVTGTSTLTGCAMTLSHNVTVYELPDVGIFASDYQMCPGETVNLTAFGAQTYIWSGNNSTNAVNPVSPSGTTTYTVFGTNTYGCVGQATQLVVVHPAPQVSGTPYPAMICAGEEVVLSGSGATSYSWMSPESYLLGNNVLAYPKTSTSYTVTGTDQNGCSASNVVVVSVDPCTGIASYGSGASIRVYPNPNSGVFSIDLGSATEAVTEISDVTGRVIARVQSQDQIVTMNIEGFASGVYYARVETASGGQVIRVIKQ